MMPVTQSHTTTGAKTPVALDYLPTSQITAAASLAGGAATVAFTVEATLDEVIDQDAANYVAPGSARWFTVTGAPTTAAGYVNFNGPWRAIRMNISAIDAGSIVFQVGQSTTPRA